MWADSTDRNDARVGTSQLIYVEIWNYEATTNSSITPDDGLNITGRYTDENKTGMTFIALDSKGDGQKFRQALAEVLSKDAHNEHAIYQ